MASTSTYLNFQNNTEEVFNFYKSIFGGEFNEHSFTRFGDMPPQEGSPELSEADKNLILHIELEITGGHSLMGSDAPESMGLNVVKGNNVHLSLQPDNREEADRLFNALSEGGEVTMPIQDTFWGAYFGSCVDKFGINWMVNFYNPE